MACKHGTVPSVPPREFSQEGISQEGISQEGPADSPASCCWGQPALQGGSSLWTRKEESATEDVGKRLITVMFSATKSKNSDSGHKNDAQLTMMTQLGDSVNKNGTAFTEHMAEV
jgi:hypothetical protein